MEVRWTQEAASDLERIAYYPLEHTPDRAAHLVRALYAPAALLFKNHGRLGKKKGPRCMVLASVGPEACRGEPTVCGSGGAVRSSQDLAFISLCSTLVAIRKGSLGEVVGCNQVQGAAAMAAFMAIAVTWFL